ncbi:hypothetical protein [Mycolicibacterium confluentis]|uniref:hypothetical protein n=1 Tax=Mycolicibacterium confluentis TaxID=28047 RepID=UPI001F3FD439|nr:hypothetical protein [Mycolicibacterium confluentis]
MAAAERWEDAFTNVHRGTVCPGGTVWEGQAAEAGQNRAFADLVKVRRLADSLQDAAVVARRGADQLDYLKRHTVDAINAARNAGFTVGENLAVTDSSRAGAFRIGHAQQHAATIASRASALIVADNDIAARITATVAQLADHKLDDFPNDRTVQAVDYKTAPPPSVLPSK